MDEACNTREPLWTGEEARFLNHESVLDHEICGGYGTEHGQDVDAAYRRVRSDHREEGLGQTWIIPGSWFQGNLVDETEEELALQLQRRNAGDVRPDSQIDFSFNSSPSITHPPCEAWIS